MSREHLLQAADALLRSVERSADAPHYREEPFLRKLQDSNRRAAKLPRPAGGKESNYLLQAEWADVIERAALTAKQLRVLGMRLEGRTFDEIGGRFGHTKQGAQNVFFQAAKKLARAWVEYPYRGLSDVYRSEVRRGLRR